MPVCLVVAALAGACKDGYIRSTDLEREGQGPDACRSACQDIGMRMTAMVLVSDQVPGCVCQPLVRMERSAPVAAPPSVAPAAAPAVPPSAAPPAAPTPDAAPPAVPGATNEPPETGAAAATGGYVVIAAAVAAARQQQILQQQQRRSWKH
ncbi:MAG TPA: hypothetical protein VHB79_18085 [Polyangiaceae bacterium]|nr:hypothetical protein [Polyangiaceae bacterium]